MFDQQGLNLQDVNISHVSFKDERRQDHRATGLSIERDELAENMHDDEARDSRVNTSVLAGDSIVDYYA
jgi:flagellar hook-length control protein FliK